MTLQKWNQHTDHLKTHISWPADKAQIIAACAGEDVEEGVMNELKNLPDKSYQNESEIKQVLVN